MRVHSNIIQEKRVALFESEQSRGLGLALLGVLGFSLTIPATKLAAPELGGVFVGLGRAIIAAGIAGFWLWRKKAKVPPKEVLGSLFLVALGVVIGFPLLTAIALQSVPASHATVMIGVVPLLTASVAVLRAKERLPLSFWGASVLGALLIVLYGALHSSEGVATLDLLLGASALLVAFGYAEGARLSASLGGQQVISWALVLASPLCLGIVIAFYYHNGITWPSVPALGGFLYVSVVSMFFAFIAWYKGLAAAGIARASQVQLLQPPLSLLWSSLFLQEAMDPLLLATMAGAVLCALAAARVRLSK